MGAELLRKICGVGISLRLIFKSSEVGQSISIKGRMESSLRTLIRKNSTGAQSSLTTHCRPVQSEPRSPSLHRRLEEMANGPQPAQCVGHSVTPNTVLFWPPRVMMFLLPSCVLQSLTELWEVMTSTSYSRQTNSATALSKTVPSD